MKKSVIETCVENGKKIGSTSIFNGIWGYDYKIKFRTGFHKSHLCEQLHNSKGYLNHISFNFEIFCQYWNNGNPINRGRDSHPCFSFYDLSCERLSNCQNVEKLGLSFGYVVAFAVVYNHL